MLSLGSYKSAGSILAVFLSYHATNYQFQATRFYFLHSLFFALLTAIIMSFAQNSQVSHSFNVALHQDHYKTILPNLSYPSRPNVHIPWSGSSAPLIFSKTTRLEGVIGTTSPPNAQIPNICSVPQTFHRINFLVWHNLSIIGRKLTQIKKKLFDFGARSPDAMASV